MIPDYVFTAIEISPVLGFLILLFILIPQEHAGKDYGNLRKLEKMKNLNESFGRESGERLVLAMPTCKASQILWLLRRRAANFGISGDRTQHLLWRIQNGEIEVIHPKLIILEIGLNNTGTERDGKTFRNTTPEIVEAIQVIVREIRRRLPESKILLMGITPAGKNPTPPSLSVATPTRPSRSWMMRSAWNGA